MQQVCATMLLGLTRLEDNAGLPHAHASMLEDMFDGLLFSDFGVG
jgi:hypothetical protein